MYQNFGNMGFGLPHYGGGFLGGLFALGSFFLVLLLAWTLVWKALALWKAARRGDKWWFIALMFVNTLGILEMLYIYFFSERNGKKSDKAEKGAGCCFVNDCCGPVTEVKNKDNDNPSGDFISFGEFSKTDLRVARIKKAEKVEGSDKLIKLSLSLGDSERQVVAGIGKAYSSEHLEGKEIVIVANLEPKKLMGLESRGMVLAVNDEDGRPVLISPIKKVKEGERLH